MNSLLSATGVSATNACASQDVASIGGLLARSLTRCILLIVVAAAGSPVLATERYPAASQSADGRPPASVIAQFPDAEMRQWHDTRGRHATMRLRAIDGDKVSFIMADGRRAATMLFKLSKADRRYVADSLASLDSKRSSPVRDQRADDALLSNSQGATSPRPTLSARDRLAPGARILPADSATAGSPGPVTLSVSPSVIGQVVAQQIGEAVPATRPLLNNAKIPATQVYLRVSREFLEDFVERDVHDSDNVRDLILGTRVVGVAHTVGKTRLSLQPNSREVVIDVELAGTSNARTTGYNGPAILHNTSTAPFRAQKRIVLTPEALAVGDAQVSARVSSRTVGIDSTMRGLRGRIVRRVATKRVAESRSEADQIASNLTSRRIGAKMNKQIGESVRSLRTSLSKTLPELPYDRQGMQIDLQMRSTPEAIEVILARQSATAEEWEMEPAPVRGNPDVALRLHRAALVSAVTTPEVRQSILKTLMAVLQNRKPQPTITEFQDDEPLPASSVRLGFDGDWLTLDFTDPKRLPAGRTGTLATDPGREPQAR